MKLGDKIGEGAYRDCFAVADNPDLCAKVQREMVTRRIPILEISLTLKTRLFLLFRYGETDLNRRENRIINKFPTVLRQYMPEVIDLRVDPSDPEKTQLVATRPRDFDGQYSASMLEYGPVDNEAFWEHVDKIAEAMVEYDLISTDVFFRGQNLLVQRVAKDHYRPVLVDVKHIGRAVPHVRKPQLIFKNEFLKAFYSKLEDFKAKFKGPETRKFQ